MCVMSFNVDHSQEFAERRKPKETKQKGNQDKKETYLRLCLASDHDEVDQQDWLIHLLGAMGGGWQ